MSKYTKLFDTTAEYNAYTADTANFITPNVSLALDAPTTVHYHQYVPPYSGFCKIYLSNGSTAEIQGSGELTYSQMEQYYYTCVSAEIGTQCTAIGDYAFNDYYGSREGFPYLSSATISNTVTSIGEGAFAYCTGLTSCTIGSGVTTIGDSVFRNCNSLTSIDIPSGVTSIGTSAFRDCNGLTSIVSNATTPPTLSNSNAFYNTNCPIYVPSGSVNAYKAATNWSTYASRIQAKP